MNQDEEDLRTALREAAVVNDASKYQADAFVRWAMSHAFDGPLALNDATDWYHRFLAEAARPAPTKQRPGDQPLPVKNDLPCIQDRVIADIEARKQVGISRYGTVLQPHNGRDPLQDAYDEAMDLTIYLCQLIYERDNPRT